VDNIEISDKSPTTYLGEYLSRFPEQRADEVYRFHASPFDWQDMEYQSFLSERRKLMADVSKAGFEQIGK
jgi:hypothetical protein